MNHKLALSFLLSILFFNQENKALYTIPVDPQLTKILNADNVVQLKTFLKHNNLPYFYNLFTQYNLQINCLTYFLTIPGIKQQINFGNPSPLLAALSKESSLNIIQALLNAGAKPLKTDAQGRNALDYVGMYYKNNKTLQSQIIQALKQAST